MTQLIRAFVNDPGVILAATLVALDFLLGVSAAVKARTFRAGWLADFLRADVVGKLIPYFAIWAAVRVGGDLDVLGVGAIEETVLGVLVVAVGGSILNSLRDLGLVRDAPDALAGSATPPPSP